MLMCEEMKGNKIKILDHECKIAEYLHIVKVWWEIF